MQKSLRNHAFGKRQYFPLVIGFVIQTLLLSSAAQTQTATPAAINSVTEPLADNVVFYVDSAGNQLPLEYNVPFRLGFSSFLVTKPEQAIVRFPQGTPLRFIARIPAGKTVDFMQLDRKGGWREIPIDGGQE